MHQHHTTFPGPGSSAPDPSSSSSGSTGSASSNNVAAATAIDRYSDLPAGSQLVQDAQLLQHQQPQYNASMSSFPAPSTLTNPPTGFHSAGQLPPHHHGQQHQQDPFPHHHELQIAAMQGVRLHPQTIPIPDTHAQRQLATLTGAAPAGRGFLFSSDPRVAEVWTNTGSTIQPSNNTAFHPNVANAMATVGAGGSFIFNNATSHDPNAMQISSDQDDHLASSSRTLVACGSSGSSSSQTSSAVPPTPGTHPASFGHQIAAPGAVVPQFHISEGTTLMLMQHLDERDERLRQEMRGIQQVSMQHTDRRVAETDQRVAETQNEMQTRWNELQMQITAIRGQLAEQAARRRQQEDEAIRDDLTALGGPAMALSAEIENVHTNANRPIIAGADMAANPENVIYGNSNLDFLRTFYTTIMQRHGLGLLFVPDEDAQEIHGTIEAFSCAFDRHHEDFEADAVQQRASDCLVVLIRLRKFYEHPGLLNFDVAIGIRHLRELVERLLGHFDNLVEGPNQGRVLQDVLDEVDAEADAYDPWIIPLANLTAERVA
ncbi:unnamed protein product [Amoebophrya sp. A120]|nr:unnamed protein product [Amoebophrya sp. A120]|eukprot:GSA120T00017887001.1